ncbi:PREDICTED: zinc finger protein 436-like [Priapulus caudatus]|uniref:Zinc finger protein 436-like n=1 Tax=Priapulus caudatus TaxID=37621 RepID=A0ABM1EP33_PRICU|nr:PREDICTED: zinc finger protein 436-like [Priapulus caudatus]
MEANMEMKMNDLNNHDHYQNMYQFPKYFVSPDVAAAAAAAAAAAGVRMFHPQERADMSAVAAAMLGGGPGDGDYELAKKVPKYALPKLEDGGRKPSCEMAMSAASSSHIDSKLNIIAPDGEVTREYMGARAANAARGAAAGQCMGHPGDMLSQTEMNRLFRQDMPYMRQMEEARRLHAEAHANNQRAEGAGGSGTQVRDAPLSTPPHDKGAIEKAAEPARAGNAAASGGGGSATGSATGSFYKCQVCDVDFTRKSSLDKHLVSHLNVGEKPHKCDLCDTRFTRMDHLKRHFRNHTGEKPHKCEHCDIAFARQDHLKKHIITHTGEKPYACNQCTQAFTRSDHLNKHKRIHTGEKLWACDMCSLSFTRSDHLSKHKRTHTGEKMWSCDMCSLAFTRSDHLNKHKRTHMRDKEWKCTFCATTFPQLEHLNEHLKVHSDALKWKCAAANEAAVGLNAIAAAASSVAAAAVPPPPVVNKLRCELCSVTFSRLDHLTRHVKNQHLGAFPGTGGIGH